MCEIIESILNHENADLNYSIDIMGTKPTGFYKNYSYFFKHLNNAYGVYISDNILYINYIGGGNDRLANLTSMLYSYAGNQLPYMGGYCFPYSKISLNDGFDDDIITFKCKLKIDEAKHAREDSKIIEGITGSLSELPVMARLFKIDGDKLNIEHGERHFKLELSLKYPNMAKKMKYPQRPSNYAVDRLIQIKYDEADSQKARYSITLDMNSYKFSNKIIKWMKKESYAKFIKHQES